MITSISIENFKGIGQRAHVPLKPVTLLFGANSSGKSTVIQALQYAWEMLENRNADVDRTRMGGEVIDLGGFRSLVHQHELERSISIGFTYSGSVHSEPYRPPEMYFSEIQDETVDWMAGDYADATDWLDIEEISIRVTATWQQGRGPYISAYEVGLNGTPFGRAEATYGSPAVLSVNSDHPFFADNAMNSYSEYGRDVMYAIQEEFGDKIEVFVKRFRRMSSSEQEEIRKLLEESTAKSVSEDRDEDGEPTSPEERKHTLPNVIPDWGRFLTIRTLGESDDEKKGVSSEVIWVLSQLLVGSGEAVLNELRGLRYLGPLREVPNRTYTAPLKPEKSRWATGLGAWDSLLRINDDENGSRSLLERCNHYLNDVLGLGYTVRRERRIQLPEESQLMAELRLFATQYEERDAQQLQRRVLDPLERLPRVPALQLYDEEKEIDVDPMDIGVGVSQTLPVVVGALDDDCRVFAVEQPELHIHPAVQVGLGDLFLREVLTGKSRQRSFLLETHSEHLVLRIMKRMRQTHEGDLPGGFPEVNPDDVCVLYVEAMEGKTFIREMPLNQRGELVKAWPGGFFEEGLRETL